MSVQSSLTLALFMTTLLLSLPASACDEHQRIFARKTTAADKIHFLEATKERSATAPFESQIRGYEDIANRIYQHQMADSQLFARLTHMCDRFGHRLSGSRSLENAISWVVNEMRRDQFDLVYTEDVQVPHWVRGEESLTLIEPRAQDLALLGLGGSIPTPANGIEAGVMVVHSFAELRQRAGEVPGKIILFNVPFTKYGETVQYRVNGAIEAARYGALASLVRSVGPRSLYTPHTGSVRYNDSVTKIPAAAISSEDADMIDRLVSDQQSVRVRLSMSCQTLPDAVSRNIIAEIKGTESPDEVVVFGGHIDSWDVGTGAMDDAGGCFAAWHALKTIRTLGLKPKRTIRVVFWTNEENGLRGAVHYAKERPEQMSKHVFCMESDMGTFDPRGFDVAGSDSTMLYVREIASLYPGKTPLQIKRGDPGADVSPLVKEGIPGAGLVTDPTHYFWYHHTEADTIDKLSAEEVKACAAAMAILAFVAGDLPQRIPR